jgi:fucose 4-O-acetylase-like acetyltransferase
MSLHILFKLEVEKLLHFKNKRPRLPVKMAAWAATACWLGVGVVVVVVVGLVVPAAVATVVAVAVEVAVPSGAWIVGAAEPGTVGADCSWVALEAGVQAQAQPVMWACYCWMSTSVGDQRDQAGLHY